MSSPSAFLPVSREDLGLFEKSFLVPSVSWLRIAAYVGCGLATGLGIMLLKINQQLELNTSQGLADKLAVGSFVLGFFCLLGGLLHTPAKTGIALFRGGLAIEVRGKVDEFRWDEIHEYFHSEVGEPFRLTTLAKQELQVPNEITDFNEVCTEIRKRCGEAIFIREFQVIADGGIARFGPLALNRDGFRYESMFYEWSSVRRMYSRHTDGKATLTFELNPLGSGPRVPAEKIHSFEVCLRLIEHLAPNRLLS